MNWERWVYGVCGISTLISIAVSFVGIWLQLKNYRKPFEQRLIVRILALVPIFAISCYCMLTKPSIGHVIEPIREIYEAFVIYMFYKLLVLMLGGERRIILNTVNKPAIKLGILEVNISDPRHFLMIKRCILQYVWMKPLLLCGIFIGTKLGIYDANDISVHSLFLWIGIFYNLSVTVSLYSIALFWRCLYEELAVFDPWRKFLCVKLIIFASYWQGIFIGIGNWLTGSNGEFGGRIQNALLCVEMLFFARLHWVSFPYTDYLKIPDAARMPTLMAMKDWISIGDLVHDLKVSFGYGVHDTYTLRNFDARDESTDSGTFNQKVYQGLRVQGDGRRYWLDDDPSHSVNTPLYVRDIEELGYGSLDESDDFGKDEKLYSYVKSHYISEAEINYPVVYEYDMVDHSTRIRKLRNSLRDNQQRRGCEGEISIS
ncbi:uncharacterized protein C5L36_0C01020 [Pichia kudriavzevii]|uniref:DUF300-domain-containing protein n=1 Tax=Pichia kudriavzevii TaxID=4909 RepID=A0A2U9R4V5_PICKU|nr:uncharacterized protein C5L36_0C01020 [Pichia kudriavzevii]AWU76156.1 hypothetical protein C5L36_0C01020 [Pichia kudriavzevii]